MDVFPNNGDWLGTTHAKGLEMAKQKTKRGPMETEATETSPLVWEWTVGKFAWVYDAGQRGLNLSVRALDNPGDEMTPILYVKNLEHGIMYAWGFLAGINQAN